MLLSSILASCGTLTNRDRISASVSDTSIKQAIEGSLISRSQAAQECPARLPKLKENATYADLVKRTQQDAALYNECAYKHSTLVRSIKEKEESVDLSPVGQQGL